MISLGYGEDNPTIDAGLYQLATVGNTVWFDENNNGIFDSGEIGVPNVTVRLYNSAGVLIATAVTDGNGSFVFSDINPGDYYIEFSVPDGYVVSPQDQGGNDSTDSDADPNTGRTAIFSLNVGDIDLTWWLGLSRPPTAITLLSFTGEMAEGGMHLRWITGMELNSLGFEIYRSADGTRAGAERITSQMIVARGSAGSGASYSWLDKTAQPGVAYRYWLVEVERGGLRTEYELEAGATTQQTYRIMLPLLFR
ncbi:MAG: hypothetical protein HC822_09260 [Oscillochloris sp.]|nr:hypothetical protein [Oscillochloris sp.]